jgi:hypothetical protein
MILNWQATQAKSPATRWPAWKAGFPTLRSASSAA